MLRNTGLARNMMRYIVPALLLVSLIPVLRSFFQTQPQTLQPHEPTSPTFGIGLDLGASYGYANLLYIALTNYRPGLWLSRIQTALYSQSPKLRATQLT